MTDTINLALQRPKALIEKQQTKKQSAEEAKQQKGFLSWYESQSTEYLQEIIRLAETNAHRVHARKPVTKPNLEGAALTYYNQMFEATNLDTDTEDED